MDPKSAVKTAIFNPKIEKKCQLKNGWRYRKILEISVWLYFLIFYAGGYLVFQYLQNEIFVQIFKLFLTW